MEPDLTHFFDEPVLTMEEILELTSNDQAISTIEGRIK